MKKVFILLTTIVLVSSCSTFKSETKQEIASSENKITSNNTNREIASTLPSYEESETYFRNGSAHSLPIWNCYKAMGQVTKNTSGMFGGRNEPNIGRIVYTQVIDQFTRQKNNAVLVTFPNLFNQNTTVRLSSKSAFQVTNQVLTAKCLHIENSIKNMICEITSSRGEKVFEYFQNELCATDNRISKDDLL